MTSSESKRSVAPHPEPPLHRALDRSEEVQGKVEQAGTDLGSVNAVLKQDFAEREPRAKAGLALAQSRTVELNVQEAAAELEAVNLELMNELDERQRLEEQLARSNSALEECKQKEQASRNSALHDAVTGLPNFTLFTDRLRTALAQARRHDWRLAVMFIDLDDFKEVNDTHGHDVGDHVLQTVAKRMQASVRGSDTVSRRSGDEFLFLMLEAKDERNASTLASKVAASIAAPLEVDGVELTVRASVGVAVYPEDGDSPEELLRNADAAMYAAKRNERSPILYSEIPPPTGS